MSIMSKCQNKKGIWGVIIELAFLSHISLNGGDFLNHSKVGRSENGERQRTAMDLDMLGSHMTTKRSRSQTHATSYPPRSTPQGCDSLQTTTPIETCVMRRHAGACTGRGRYIGAEEECSVEVQVQHQELAHRHEERFGGRGYEFGVGWRLTGWRR
jgi:hypothetical protein